MTSRQSRSSSPSRPFDVRRRTTEKSIQRFERLPRISQADELVLRELKTELATLNERREELIAAERPRVWQRRAIRPE